MSLSEERGIENVYTALKGELFASDFVVGDHIRVCTSDSKFFKREIAISLKKGRSKFYLYLNSNFSIRFGD